MKNVIYILVDALSYDNIGKKAYRNSPTPFLDKISEKSLYCENMYTQAPYTEAAFISSLAGEKTLENGGYMLGLKKCKKSYGELLGGKGYKTFSTFSPYVYSSTYVKAIEQYFYSRIYSLSPLKIYRLSYFRDLYDKSKLTREHLAVCEELLEDAFEIWLDQLNGLLGENEHNIMVQKLVSVKIIPEVKALVEAEYKQFKTDSHKYVSNLFENWDKHSLFLIKTLECKEKHSEKVHSEIVKNEMEYLEKIQEKYRRLMKKNMKIDWKYLFDLARYDDSEKLYGARHALNGYLGLYNSTLLTDVITKHVEYDKITISAKTQLDVFYDKIKQADENDENYYAFIHIEDLHLPCMYYTYDTDDYSVIQKEFEYHKKYTECLPANYRGNLAADLSTHYIDYYLGQFFEKMNQNKKNDFLFIVTADHGFPSNYNPPRPLIYNSFYQENYHIPFIMYDSKEKKQLIDYELHSSRDIFDFVIGKALEEKNVTLPNRDYVMVEYPGPGCPDISKNRLYYAIHDGNYKIAAKAKLTENIDEETVILIFNVREDPDEKKNLVRKEYDNEQVSKLIRILQKRHEVLREKYQGEKFYKYIVNSEEK